MRRSSCFVLPLSLCLSACLGSDDAPGVTGPSPTQDSESNETEDENDGSESTAAGEDSEHGMEDGTGYGSEDNGVDDDGEDEESFPSAEPEDQVPSEVPYCDEVSNWDPAWIEFENEVFKLTNEARTQEEGVYCGARGQFPPTHALEKAQALRCAARKHSMDMAKRDFTDHNNPDGETPFDRIDQAGYSYRRAGENIAWGYSTPKRVVDGWLESDDHCANLMSEEFEEIGVGYYRGGQERYYWTQNFGLPKEEAEEGGDEETG